MRAWPKKTFAGAASRYNWLMNSVRYTVQESSLGPLFLRAQGGKLSGLFFADQPHGKLENVDWVRDDELELFTRTIREVEEFAAGERQEFNVEKSAAGTCFQLQVWQEIAAIPYGETVTYGEIARRVGSPAAVRAVGTAAGRNPLCLIVPCHRVIGSSGELTGYAGGIERKRRLLELERTAAFASCSGASC